MLINVNPRLCQGEIEIGNAMTVNKTFGNRYLEKVTPSLNLYLGNALVMTIKEEELRL